MSKNNERLFFGLAIFVLSVFSVILIFEIYALRSQLTSAVRNSSKKIGNLTDSLSESKKTADIYRKKAETKVAFMDVFEPISSNSFQLARDICKQLNATDVAYQQLLKQISIPENYDVNGIDMCGTNGSYTDRMYVVRIESMTGKSDIMLFDVSSQKQFGSESDIYGKSCEYYGSRKYIRPPTMASYRGDFSGHEHFIRCFATIVQTNMKVLKEPILPILYVLRKGYGIEGQRGFVTCAKEFGYCLDSDTLNRLKDYKIIN